VILAEARDVPVVPQHRDAVDPGAQLPRIVVHEADSCIPSDGFARISRTIICPAAPAPTIRTRRFAVIPTFERLPAEPDQVPRTRTNRR
jgi:hypothetical protein